MGKTTGSIKENGTYSGSPKLVPHLFDHLNYVVHYRNLKYLVDLGVKVTKLHEVITFKQSAWMKPYIEFNSIKRAQAKNDFEKGFLQIDEQCSFWKNYGKC